MKLKIEIDSDNASCQSTEDACRLVASTMRKIVLSNSFQHSGPIYDEDGNKVGSWEFNKDEVG